MSRYFLFQHHFVIFRMKSISNIQRLEGYLTQKKYSDLGLHVLHLDRVQ